MPSKAVAKLLEFNQRLALAWISAVASQNDRIQLSIAVTNETASSRQRVRGDNFLSPLRPVIAPNGAFNSCHGTAQLRITVTAASIRPILDHLICRPWELLHLQRFSDNVRQEW